MYALALHKWIKDSLCWRKKDSNLLLEATLCRTRDDGLVGREKHERTALDTEKTFFSGNLALEWVTLESVELLLVELLKNIKIGRYLLLRG